MPETLPLQKGRDPFEGGAAEESLTWSVGMPKYTGFREAERTFTCR